MDFSNRGAQHTPAAPAATNNSQSTKKGGDSISKWLKVASVVLLFSITILLVALAFLLSSNNGSNENKYLQSGSFQAVDISVGGSSNGDQIYFGNIKDLNDKYMVLDNVYYIPSTTSGSNVTLEPLVCQVDKPFNRMVVNRGSVNWWENLQSDGQVAKAITNYQKSNPKGPSCPTSSSSSNSSSTNTTTTPSTTTTTPATTTPTTNSTH